MPVRSLASVSNAQILTMYRRGSTATQIGTFTPQLAPSGLEHTTKQSSQNGEAPPPRSPRPEKRPLSDSAHKEGNKVTKRARIEQWIGPSTRVAYHEFMVLDQAGSAVMACDNTIERELVAIKRFKCIDQSLMRKILPFRSDYVVNIKETYFDDDNIVIIYEHMDISLRNVTSILQGPFKPFQIAAICKEVSINLNRAIPSLTDSKTARSRSFLYT